MEEVWDNKLCDLKMAQNKYSFGKFHLPHNIFGAGGRLVKGVVGMGYSISSLPF